LVALQLVEKEGIQKEFSTVALGLGLERLVDLRIHLQNI
jgi:phenylalanyl-tRNA synthetase alpha subunit